MSYTPPFTITSKILSQVSDIAEIIAEIKHIDAKKITPTLRKKNRVKSITGSLQIEGNSFTEEQVTAMIDGKRVLGSLKEVEEVKGAIAAYEKIDSYDYAKLDDLLQAHRLMMNTLLNNAGSFRNANVGVYGKSGVSHVAPPPYRIPELMRQLFQWLERTQDHPLESIVKENQQHYYKALEESGSIGESSPFIEFMLQNILQALRDFVNDEHKSNQESNLKSDQKVLSLIKSNSKITIRELCEIIAMSESGVKKVIKKLKDENKIARVGSLKAGYWEVKE